MSASLSVDQIRARIGHPVIDADGHMLEFLPVVRQYLKDLAGESAARYFDDMFYSQHLVHQMPAEDMRQLGLFRLTWWGFPARNTLDRATAHLPRLMYERLDEFGLDFAIVYPTHGLGVPLIPEDELRVAACRAFNQYYADEFRDLADRMTPAAIIPMHTPEEAIDELDYAVNTLGLKTAVVAGHTYRPLQGDNLPRAARWADTFGIDSPYDYDPVWAKCIELGIAPTFHASGMGWQNRASVSNYVYNHIGSFAAAGEATCRSLIMGGVPQRFPALRMAFLEGGVGWATNLYSDLIGHWEKRSRDIDHYNPAHLDRDALRKQFERYGSERYLAQLEHFDAVDVMSMPLPEGVEVDDYARAGFSSPEDIRELFETRLYFGCEADDPMNASAFNTRSNPLGAKLKPIFSSDIGHWDVPEMNGVLQEAWELVEDELLSESEFAEFVWHNDAEMLLGANPAFFDGTALAGQTHK